MKTIEIKIGNNLKLTRSELVDARDWLLDCCVNEDDVDYVNDMTCAEVEAFVARKYTNGLQGFLNDYGPEYVRK